MISYLKKMICLTTLFIPCIFFVADASADLATFNAKLSAFKTEKYSHNSIYQNNSALAGGIECFGFANEVALYIWGSYPTSSMSATSVNSGWKVTYGGNAVDTLCVGDIVRYHYHSIFITGISGDTIYYCHANSPSGTNKITYDNTISRSNLKSKVSENLTSPNTTKNGWVAHYTGGLNPSTSPNTEAPTNVKVTTAGTDVTVSWDIVANATSYDVYLIQSPWGWEDIKYSKSVTSTTHTFTNVSTGEYCAFVISRPNSDNVQSEWKSFSVKPVLSIAPIAQVDTEYTFTGSDITVSWNGVDYADKYLYYLGQHPTGFTYNTPVKSGITTDLSVTFSALPVGEYIFFVHAANDSGNSPQSNWVNIVVNDKDYIPVATEIYNNHMYVLYDNWTTWSYARQLCQKMGGHLVTITSKEENSFIEAFLDNGSCSGYWIGLTDENQTSNDFKWVTGESFEFSDWATGDPNNWGEYGNREDFVQIHKNYNYDWIDTSNRTETTVGFVLEIELDNIFPTSKKTYKGNNYLLFDCNMTWTEAKQYCESIGGHLATINSAEEYEFISKFLENGNRLWYLLGARKDAGTFKWIDTNESVSVTGVDSHWLDGTPTSDLYNNYMMMYKDSKKWLELKNYYEYSDHMKYLGFVCEIEGLYTTVKVDSKNTVYDVEVKIHNSSELCDIIVAGYTYSGKLEDTKIIPYENQESIKLELRGNIEVIKVMIWNGLSQLKPMCEAEVIPSSEFVVE